jgi:transcriptional/translational regulatory protein YebC/TACO1
VSHGFDRLGLIEYPASVGDEDKVEAAIEAGADDVESDMGDGDENPGSHQIWVAVDRCTLSRASWKRPWARPKA